MNELEIAAILTFAKYGVFEPLWSKIFFKKPPLKMADLAVKIGEILKVENIAHLRDYITLVFGPDELNTQEATDRINEILIPIKNTLLDTDSENPFVYIHTCVVRFVVSWNRFQNDDSLGSLDNGAAAMACFSILIKRYRSNPDVEKLFQDLLTELNLSE